MDLRKNPFLEKLISKLHARNRVVSTFGFCLMFPLLLFYFLIPINTNTLTTSLSHHITLTKSFLANQSARVVEMKETQEGNLSRSGLIGKDLEKANERSLTKGGVVKSRSGKELEKAHERNLSLSCLVESGRGKEVDKAHERNLSMSDVIRSSSGKELEKANEKNFSVSSLVGSGGGRELEKAHGRNLSISGLVGNSSGKELEKMHENNISLSDFLKNSNEKATRIFRKCDIFYGRWVSDEGVPHYYPPGSCPYIDNDFNCHRNHRPDDKFLKWRWQPKGCNIPRLDPVDFLRRLRGKRLIFVGDSLNRNMWESLVCILRHSVPNKRRVYEISGRNQFKARGYYSVKFKGYNCSVDFVHSPFLVRETRRIGVTGKVDEKLRLDLMEETTSTYIEADIVVFNTGHWWTHEKTSSGVDYYQEGNHVYPVLEPSKAYEKALTTWASWVDNNINANKTRVLFRSYSPTHFSGGRWNSGGQCHKETEPIFNDKFLDEYPSKMRTLQRVLQKMKTPVIYLNITRLTDYRKDGHPSIYRRTYNMIKDLGIAEKYQDCSHWCLPGIPDTWNELLYASLLIDRKGSWRNRLSRRGWFSTARS